MSPPDPSPPRHPQGAGPSFASQGIGIAEALFELGLLSDPFYDSLAPADPAEVDALAQWFGAPLPAQYRQFLDEAGGSLGTLRIVDWQTPWDFRPGAVLANLEARTEDDRRQLRESGQLPIAVLGPSMEVGYDYEAVLLLDPTTGEVAPEDMDRRPYEDLTALLLEWGHRVLDPNMAVPGDRLRAWQSDLLPPSRIHETHALAASHLGSDGVRFVGRWLGVYRYHRSGLILRQDGPEQVWVEGYAARRVGFEQTAAAAVLQEGRRRGWIP